MAGIVNLVVTQYVQEEQGAPAAQLAWRGVRAWRPARSGCWLANMQRRLAADTIAPFSPASVQRRFH